MDTPIRFTLDAIDGSARMGRLETHHGTITTPCFMPVGTRATVKAMAPDELWQLGYRLVLANTYHLALRPGAELIEELGGVGRFMGFDGAVLTDSAGLQNQPYLAGARFLPLPANTEWTQPVRQGELLARPLRHSLNVQ